MINKIFLAAAMSLFLVTNCFAEDRTSSKTPDGKPLYTFMILGAYRCSVEICGDSNVKTHVVIKSIEDGRRGLVEDNAVPDRISFVVKLKNEKSEAFPVVYGMNLNISQIYLMDGVGEINDHEVQNKIAENLKVNVNDIDFLHSRINGVDFIGKNPDLYDSRGKKLSF